MRMLPLFVFVSVVSLFSVYCCRCNQEDYSEILSLTVGLHAFGDVEILSGYSKLDFTIGEHEDTYLELETWFESKGRNAPEIRGSIGFVCTGIEEFQYEPGVVEIKEFQYGQHGWFLLREDIRDEAIPFSSGEKFEKLDKSLGVCVYSFDVAAIVEQAQKEIWSEEMNCNASDILVKGRLSFITRVFGCIRTTAGTERDITIKLRFFNVTDLRATLRTAEKTTILHAETEEIEMSRILPNKVGHTFLADSDSLIYQDMYVEWKILEIPEPLWEKVPWNWILSGIVGFVIGSTLDRVIVVVGERRKAEQEKTKRDRRTRASKTRSVRRTRKKSG